jgi:hypothetical protein
MNMPGFTADASLRAAASRFGGRPGRHTAANAVMPALICDETCLIPCLEDLSDCDDVPYWARPACQGAVIRHNAACRRKCCR